MTSSLDLDAVLARSERVIFRELDSEAVLLDLDTGRYYGLDPVGARIWALIGEQGRLREVFGRLCAEYEVSPERLRGDLLALVGDLLRNGLVRPRAPADVVETDDPDGRPVR